MPQENVVFYNPMDEMDEDLNINFLKIWKTIWYRRELLIKVFCSVLIFFILLTESIFLVIYLSNFLERY